MLPLAIPFLVIGAAALLERRTGPRSNPAGATVGRGRPRAPGEAVSYMDAGVVDAPDTEPPTEPTRPSCTECVEKHLSAAWILMKEHRDGYAHRWLAIGHLHEAEDESQAWPDLSTRIRDARKEYQRAGKVPDFMGLMDVVDAIKATGATG